MSSLGNFNILIADADVYLSSVTKAMLQGMGFRNIQMTNSGNAALSLIQTQSFDFVITEWNLKEIDGIKLIQHIRRAPNSKNPTLPVIMLTGRMEQSDVQAARDSGIHEYVIKPFSAKNIYNRLERIVDFPRYFVVGGNFVGPDRRHGQLPSIKDERRKRTLVPERKPWDTTSAIQHNDSPSLWLPDFSMKHKLGREVKLESIITPGVVAQAQAVINSSTEASVKLIKRDLDNLQSLFGLLRNMPDNKELLNEAVEVSLMISSRSGTFSYMRASEVAYQLYLFMRRYFKGTNANHFKATDKHLEVLQLIFSKNILHEEGDILDIIKALKTLTDKYAKARAQEVVEEHELWNELQPAISASNHA